MIEKTLKTISGKLKIKIPSSLNEVTLGQMIELQEKENLNDLEAISILSGIPINQLNNVCSLDDLRVFGDAILSLSNQIKYMYDSEKIPEKINFCSGNTRVCVNVMRNLSIEPAGAFMAARDIISDEINEHIKKYSPDDWQEHFNPSLKACCQVLAHYFFCRVTGKIYNEYEVEEFCNEVKKLGVAEALPVSKHFFTCYPGLSKPKTSFFRRFLQRWKRRLGSSRSKSLNI
ncbi:MAG TPA: hypothetical protein VNW95_10745 [Mucilaginibacter sp.]|jgi:hypothetical protein|nr:hypothetical protein [Mucilaginibacter sp.]